MAEVVQKRIEGMTEEMEEMRRIKLFSVEETRVIMRRRKEFEHKIHAVTKEFKNFTDYINYERTLLKDINLRRNKFKIGEKKASIEFKIIKRIQNLYNSALQRFPNEISIFLSFLKFCRKVNQINAASEAVASIVKKHPDNPDMWKVVANWHAYDRKDINTAKIMLLKAVAIHKDSQLLYKEMIQLELHNLIETGFEKIDYNKNLKKLEEIIKATFINIKDCNFQIQLLEILEEYDITTSVQAVIVNHLMKEYLDNEYTWHTFAQRERKGFSYQINVEGKVELESTKSRTPKARLEACFSKYKEGLSKVSLNTRAKLWILYLDFLLELQQDTFTGATVLKTETLKQALNEASSEGYLQETHYMAWLDLVPENEALGIAEKGTTAIPTSLALWKTRLRLSILKTESSEVDQVFKLGIGALKENALPLWTSILKYHYLTSDDHIINLIYKDGIKQAKEISDVLKPQYIEWLALGKGIESAREVYRTLSTKRPFCKDLHLMMAKLESIQIDYDIKCWSSVLKLACEQFGGDDVDVWINYIQFELDFNRESQNVSQTINTLCRTAENVLPPPLVVDFSAKYRKMTEDL